MDPTGYLFWERQPVFLDNIRKCGLGQEMFYELSMQTNTNKEIESWFEDSDPESWDGFWESWDDREEVFSDYWNSQSEEDREDDREDSSERATGPTPSFSSDSDSTSSGESCGDKGRRSPSGVESNARDIRSTRQFENNDTSGSNQNSQQLAEKLARAEERIAILESENKELRARK